MGKILGYHRKTLVKILAFFRILGTMCWQDMHCNLKRGHKWYNVFRSWLQQKGNMLKKKNYTHQQNIKKQNKTLWNFNQPWLLITLAAHINPCDFEDSIGFHDAKKSSESLAPKLLLVFEDVGMGKFTSIQMCTTEQCSINAKCSHLPLLGLFQLTWGPDQKIYVSLLKFPLNFSHLSMK